MRLVNIFKARLVTRPDQRSSMRMIAASLVATRGHDQALDNPDAKRTELICVALGKLPSGQREALRRVGLLLRGGGRDL
jgi:hypothetical protein